MVVVRNCILLSPTLAVRVLKFTNSLRMRSLLCLDYFIPFSREQHILVAGAGLEPAISAYETERITIFHIPQYVVRTGFEPVTLP
jgi:hypothetical protein